MMRVREGPFVGALAGMAAVAFGFVAGAAATIDGDVIGGANGVSWGCEARGGGGRAAGRGGAGKSGDEVARWAAC